MKLTDEQIANIIQATTKDGKGDTIELIRTVESEVLRLNGIGDGMGEAALPDEWPEEFCTWYRDLPELKPEKLWQYWAAVHSTPPQQQQAAPVQDGWQPIETAPKDGTVIDLWHEEFGREADCYWGLPHHCCGEMGSLCDSDWHDLEPGWVGTFNEIMSPENNYTHWRAIPAAPKVQEPEA